MGTKLYGKSRQLIDQQEQKKQKQISKKTREKSREKS